jgi:hypothetical protein
MNRSEYVLKAVCRFYHFISTAIAACIPGAIQKLQSLNSYIVTVRWKSYIFSMLNLRFQQWRLNISVQYEKNGSKFIDKQ